MLVKVKNVWLKTNIIQHVKIYMEGVLSEPINLTICGGMT
jgi:hypothetical protein